MRTRNWIIICIFLMAVGYIVAYKLTVKHNLVIAKEQLKSYDEFKVIYSDDNHLVLANDKDTIGIFFKYNHTFTLESTVFVKIK